MTLLTLDPCRRPYRTAAKHMMYKEEMISIYTDHLGTCSPPFIATF